MCSATGSLGAYRNNQFLPMKVLIIGCGLGGLTAALSFAKNGCDVFIFERRKGLSPQGGSIMIRSGACNMLHRLGLQADLQAMSDRVPTTLVRSMQTGDIIKRYPVEVSEAPAWGTTRQDLMHLLYRKVREAGADIRFGHFVVDICDDSGQQRPSIQLENGEVIDGDIILVADGIKSRLRAKVLSLQPGASEPEPIISDTTFYGFNVADTELKKHNGTARLIDQTDVNIWKGQAGYVVTRHNSKTEHVSFLYGVQSETDQEELWDEEGDIDYVRQIFAESCSEVTIPLQIAESCCRWRLAEMPPILTWRTQSGRIVLLGDSAHAMHPNAGQGYSQIVEDIAVLGYLIFDGMKGVPIQDITKTWQDIRKGRVERISSFSRWKSQWFSGELAAFTQSGGWGEDAGSFQHVLPDMDAAFQTSPFLKWVLEYDPPTEARAYLREEAMKASPCKAAS